MLCHYTDAKMIAPIMSKFTPIISLISTLEILNTSLLPCIGLAFSVSFHLISLFKSNLSREFMIW